jgi:hypothetical protein
MRCVPTALLTSAALVAVGAPAFGDSNTGVKWEVRILHPTGAQRSQAQGVDRFGTVTGFVQGQAPAEEAYGYWGSSQLTPPTSASWTPLSVNNASMVRVTGQGPETAPGAGPDAAFFYGHARVLSRPLDQNPIAGHWNRATGTFTSMHPSGATWSTILGARNGQQVGELSGNRAALWSGTGVSMVVLHPFGAIASRALATDGVRQSGYAYLLGALEAHAVVWSGSAASWQSLHQPSWYTSWGLAVDGDQVVGFKRDTLVDPIFGPSAGPAHPVLWRTGQPPVNLLPPGGPWVQGEASGVASPVAGGPGVQVGVVYDAQNDSRAALWRGSAASLESLHDRLPPNSADPWRGSIATAVAGGGVKTYITGYAWGAAAFNTRAVLWIRTDNTLRCGPSDVAGPGQSVGPDGRLTADDIIVFIGWYFAGDPRADVAGPSLSVNPDGVLSADDIIVFINRFFAGC